MKRLYIAGPCTGYPEQNYPAFHAAAAQFRALGFEVENPADNPTPPCGTWQGYMRMAVIQVARCDGVVLLPGWERSEGAMVKYTLAKGMRLPRASLDMALCEWRPS